MTSAAPQPSCAVAFNPGAAKRRRGLAARRRLVFHLRVALLFNLQDGFFISESSVDFREFGELQCFMERACTKAGHISAAATWWSARVWGG